jgi:aerobic carbon-monoxide dehydrogenase small subunit
VTVRISITLNGRRYDREVEPRQLLVHFIRDLGGLTGTKGGCDTSQCGSCTVLIDGVAAKSCTCLAVQTDGMAVTTIEGLAPNGTLHPLQNAFWNTHGLQRAGSARPG